MKIKPVFIVIIVLVLIAAGVFVVITTQNKGTAPTGNTTVNEAPSQNEPAAQFSFTTPKKSAHYEGNTPAHGAILAAPPINIVLDFNFDLAVPSAISVTREGNEYATGETVIDRNKLSMRRAFNPEAPDGLYKVTYNACWPDRSCHDGHFEFAIDRASATSYVDMTGKAEVTVKMSEIMFKPKNIKISKGTKVTWINDENMEHYVNTDSHPAHTYYLPQNSSALKLNDAYSVVFDTSGIYPYHCSAHADVMIGSIIVI